ncbi:MAG: phosphoribosylformylglycinamidine cyclo-ligase [Deltaproteobacteria bacterium]|nr:phosphoribosylformylglycinamidine cyclo-ligase [Deltaproteobacteria bacterium]
MRPATYAAAGVDIDAGERLVRRIAPLARATRRREILAGVGGFAALARIPSRYRHPLLVTCTDGVGTKLRIAFALDRHDTIGIDLVAMSVNDLLTVGAEPLLFLDYFATGALDVRQGTALVRGIARGCRLAGCSLVGGETAELPSFYKRGEYDVAGFAVGVVERAAVLDGRRVRPGDALIGLPSTGLHSNGYALARKVLLARARLSLDTVPADLRVSLGEELLRPTRIYVRPVRELLATTPRAVHGMAHVTGGGLPGNLPRILPAGCRAVVRRGTWRIPPVFTMIERLGRVSRREMDRTFNNGIGFVLVVGRVAADTVVARLRARRLRPVVIGEIVRGNRGLDFV